MAVDFSKFDKAVDLDGLKEDIKEAAENGGGNREEVPKGEYEVKIDKMELTTSKKGDPMFTCWFKILAGDFKNSLIFMNQVINQGFQIHIVKEFLRSLDTEYEVDFESYTQFEQLVLDIHEAVDGQLEFVLDYGETNKGFPTFTITEVFEVE